jgi:hypothetical protein
MKLVRHGVGERTFRHWLWFGVSNAHARDTVRLSLERNLGVRVYLSPGRVIANCLGDNFDCR